MDKVIIDKGRNQSKADLISTDDIAEIRAVYGQMMNKVMPKEKNRVTPKPIIHKYMFKAEKFEGGAYNG